MASPKKYFHDHFVLLLLSINIFLAVAGSLFIVLKLSSSHGASYIVQCRNCSDPSFVNRFKPGSVTDLLALVVFALLILAVNTTLSVGAYRVRRQLSIAILSLGILLLVLTVIVSNALLVLH